LLAKKYFTSHCPATLKDFTWWSGLPSKDAKLTLELVKKNLIAEKIGAEIYWFSNSFKRKEANNPTVYLLPAYDEFLISYQDRTASLLQKHNKKVISANGIFRPLIIKNGRVIGSWKRSIQNDISIIEASLFQSYRQPLISQIKKSVEDFERFAGKKSGLIIKKISS
jgi:hypothetical protein